MPHNRLLIFIFCCFALFSMSEESVWGFYGHRLINKTAVFTLPVDLLPLYKANIDFVTEHSVDPDKRRYASPLEAMRHYIDIDVWGDRPFDEVPRELPRAMHKYGDVHVVDSDTRDTVDTYYHQDTGRWPLTAYMDEVVIEEIGLKWIELLEEGYITLPRTWLPAQYRDRSYDLIFTETFSSYGILPYHLIQYHRRLTKAFKEQDWHQAIRLSTELGHYISDAHVPLHTTVNYNGQLSDQDGIHAFWESRIPELFAASEYNLFVGDAVYIEDVEDFYWGIVASSHALVDEVLSKEKALSLSFASDQQYCFEERGGTTTRLECPAYARAYAESMSGMVEERMSASIHAVGSAWLTAWIDAERPQISSDFNEISLDTTLILKR